MNKLAVAGPNSRFKDPAVEPAGFWAGFWHGLIAPIVFFVSLFNPGVRIYETRNTGRWYDLGFLLGASSALSRGVKVNVDTKEKQETPDEMEE